MSACFFLSEMCPMNTLAANIRLTSIVGPGIYITHGGPQSVPQNLISESLPITHAVIGGVIYLFGLSHGSSRCWSGTEVNNRQNAKHDHLSQKYGCLSRQL